MLPWDWFFQARLQQMIQIDAQIQFRDLNVIQSTTPTGQQRNGPGGIDLSKGRVTGQTEVGIMNCGRERQQVSSIKHCITAHKSTI